MHCWHDSHLQQLQTYEDWSTSNCIHCFNTSHFFYDGIQGRMLVGGQAILLCGSNFAVSYQVMRWSQYKCVNAKKKLDREMDPVLLEFASESRCANSSFGVCTNARFYVHGVFHKFVLKVQRPSFHSMCIDCTQMQCVHTALPHFASQHETQAVHQCLVKM